MKRVAATVPLVSAALFLAAAMMTGCESTDGGSSTVGSTYYGVGSYDPWYYGDYDEDVVIVRPPPDRPLGPHAENPIAKPPPGSSIGARPMPSIPSMPRASFRR